MEKIIENFILNFKKYLYALLGLVTGILFIEYGFFKTLLIILFTLIGFKFGDLEFVEKINKYILKKLKN